MKHLKKIKQAALASVLVASMVVGMLGFVNINGRNGPGEKGKVLEKEEEDVSVAGNISILFLTYL